MRWYDASQKPFSVHGLAVNGEDGRFWRMPPEVIDTVSPAVSELARCAVGGRVRFRTDARRLCVRYAIKACSPDILMSPAASLGCDLYVGAGKEARFVGCIGPSGGQPHNEKTFSLGEGVKQVTIGLPRNQPLRRLEVGLSEGEVWEAAPYAFETPVYFYGSSITAGAHACRPGLSYTATVCRWLDSDYCNLGFSGSARGEKSMARYIAGCKMRALVLDYDHNAPTPQDLADTHERFFRLVRNAQPSLPIVFMTRPDFGQDPEDAALRRAIVLGTYQNALAKGDRNVRFLDGGAIFATADAGEYSSDLTHPNDMGFRRMADALYPILRPLLG